ncbi:hypothetical protein A8V01_15920 [Novosphingobium guangzhouense]|uniref:Uncharacterized protein n=1 Tax=Novosphingobium guangzhouense TaxID=1850347 RepID=A0A2K2G372_9SPHN|nr:hypothetical protein A8V01_15920 [Novosphingobium guangzhouense]
MRSGDREARIAAHKSPIIETCAQVQKMLDLARADLRRLEEQEFAALTVDEVKAKIDALQKGA